MWPTDLSKIWFYQVCSSLSHPSLAKLQISIQHQQIYTGAQELKHKQMQSWSGLLSLFVVGFFTRKQTGIAVHTTSIFQKERAQIPKRAMQSLQLI